MTTTCQHPADKASTETLLLHCPDCGADCSQTSIGDDDLCYDQNCPLHVLAGPPASTEYSVNVVDSEAPRAWMAASLHHTEEYAKAMSTAAAAGERDAAEWLYETPMEQWAAAVAPGALGADESLINALTAEKAAAYLGVAVTYDSDGLTELAKRAFAAYSSAWTATVKAALV